MWFTSAASVRARHEGRERMGEGGGLVVESQLKKLRCSIKNVRQSLWWSDNFEPALWGILYSWAIWGSHIVRCVRFHFAMHPLGCGLNKFFTILSVFLKRWCSRFLWWAALKEVCNVRARPSILPFLLNTSFKAGILYMFFNFYAYYSWVSLNSVMEKR